MQQDQVPTPGCAIFAQPPEYHHTYIILQKAPLAALTSYINTFVSNNQCISITYIIMSMCRLLKQTTDPHF